MQQLYPEIRIVLNLVIIKVDNILHADTQTRGVELRIGLLFCGNTYAEVAWGVHFNLVVVQVKFLFIIKYRDDVFKTIMQHINYISFILKCFKAVADNGNVFSY